MTEDPENASNMREEDAENKGVKKLQQRGRTALRTLRQAALLEEARKAGLCLSRAKYWGKEAILSAIFGEEHEKSATSSVSTTDTGKNATSGLSSSAAMEDPANIVFLSLFGYSTALICQFCDVGNAGVLVLVVTEAGRISCAKKNSESHGYR